MNDKSAKYIRIEAEFWRAMRDEVRLRDTIGPEELKEIRRRQTKFAKQMHRLEGN